MIDVVGAVFGIGLFVGLFVAGFILDRREKRLINRLKDFDKEIGAASSAATSDIDDDDSCDPHRSRKDSGGISAYDASKPFAKDLYGG